MDNRDKRSSLRASVPQEETKPHHVMHPMSNLAPDEEDMGAAFADSAAVAAAAFYGGDIHSYSGGSETPAAPPDDPTRPTGHPDK